MGRAGCHEREREVPARGIKTTVMTVLASSLVAGSAVGVAAQDESFDPTAWSTFEWRSVGE